ncbi:RAMP superfamily CRISPR-associated protein [Leptolyngbya sp. AN03gr2]|uniref:RAMP superfamily CRISPR-associated protein n=1 Tax=unclassified Leptolyngbya TaxID=2650499 RepID=UPI003D313DF9
MKAITIVLKTQQPILATSFQGDPNSDVSYSYLPGSMIRGALISRYLKRHDLPEDILQDATVRRLFFDGTTRYLNAYLCRDKQRSLPVPLSWNQPKTAEVPCQLYDLSRFDLEDLEEEIALKSVSKAFCTVHANQTFLYSEQRRINIHNLRNRKRGRSVDGSGEIFRYDAIDAGQTFQAVILCEAADVDTLQGLLAPIDLWIGGSQSAGYGHIQIQAVKVHDRWTETSVQPIEQLRREAFTITLLSDMILRDQWGQAVADPQILIHSLEAKLQKPLKLIQGFVRSTLVGGFNRKWGLPLPQVQALSAGSVFVCEPIELTAQQIQDLEAQSIGDRTTEGFGRIAINWLEEHSTFQASLPEEVIQTGSISLSEPSRQIARGMAERLLRQKMERLLEDRVEKFRAEEVAITNSQLSRLMILARQALQNENQSDLVQSLLENLPSNARGKFERTKVNSNQSLDRQILEWLNQPKGWITNLPSVTIAGESLELSDELAREYTLRLIIAVAKKMRKEKSQ